MKYYETTFDEYITAVNKYNLHPEIENLVETRFPKYLRDFGNIIIYGSSGVGKYSQVLHFLKKYSPTEIKYEKHITIQTEKQTYNYSMSDIHYEIDMSFLGCNSKMLWHELFFQIVDIVAVKPEKIGIIVCKNFHMIHSELLEIFYSYMQQYNNSYMNILIKFIIITEHISFIPTNIMNSCEVLAIERPPKEAYIKMIEANKMKNSEKIKQVMEELEINTILNLKEIRSYSMVKSANNLPTDIFNTICNQIIEDMTNVDMDFIKFRDSLYDILIYNLDVAECLWYILTHFIGQSVEQYAIQETKHGENTQNINKLERKDISQVLQKTYSFLKYYNNNYRPIYHLESIFFYLIIKIHKYDEHEHEYKIKKREPATDDNEKSDANSGNRKQRKSGGRPDKKALPNVGAEISSR
jgi:hypothetical protein